MAENSKIEWTDHTFNPWIGCTKVAPECDNCYADLQDRFRKWTPDGWGAGKPRKRTKTWADPLKWNAGAAARGGRARVFCASLADVFDGEVPIEWRADLWRLIQRTPDLDWLLLTKRPGNLRTMLPFDSKEAGWGVEWPWPNVWLGTSVGTVVRKPMIDVLRREPAAIRFLSCEPLLEDLGKVDLTGIDWVICGGESGFNARPMHPDWARSLRDQCVAAGVPFFFKQWGEWVTHLDRDIEDPDWRAHYAEHREPGYRVLNLAGGEGFHGERVHIMRRVGKKAAGRLLDGREWNEFPSRVPGDREALAGESMPGAADESAETSVAEVKA